MHRTFFSFILISGITTALSMNAYSATPQSTLLEKAGNFELRIQEFGTPTNTRTMMRQILKLVDQRLSDSVTVEAFTDLRTFRRAGKAAQAMQDSLMRAYGFLVNGQSREKHKEITSAIAEANKSLTKVIILAGGNSTSVTCTRALQTRGGNRTGGPDPVDASGFPSDFPSRTVPRRNPGDGNIRQVAEQPAGPQYNDGSNGDARF